MTRSIDIFAESEAGVEDFVKEIGSLLNVELRRATDGEEVWYESANPHVLITVGQHDFENDRDMDFQDYRYDIAVRALNIGAEEERKQWRDDFARFIFDKLKATRRYPLMMVENLGVKSDEFHPNRDHTI